MDGPAGLAASRGRRCGEVCTRAREIVLASGSRARREMLAAAGVHFTVQAADVDEPAIRARMRGMDANVEPKRIAAVLAAAKAEDVSGKKRGSLVIGADQVLALDRELLSKAAEPRGGARSSAQAARAHARIAFRRRLRRERQDHLGARRHGAPDDARFLRRVPRRLSATAPAIASVTRSAPMSSKASACSCSTRSRATTSPCSACRCCRCSPSCAQRGIIVT